MNDWDDREKAIADFWAPDSGVFWKLRSGKMELSELDDVVKALGALEIAEDERLPRRFVSLVWYIPIFMEWQRQRCAEKGQDMVAFESRLNALTEAVQNVLGVP